MTELLAHTSATLIEYSSPVLTAACFYTLHLYSALKLKKAQLGYSSRRRRQLLVYSVLTISATFALLAVTASLAQLRQDTPEDRSHEVVGYAVSALLWIAIWRQIRMQRRLQWRHMSFTISCALASQVFEASSKLPPEASFFLVGSARVINISSLFSCLTLTTYFYATPISSPDSTGQPSKSKEPSSKTWEIQDSDVADDEDDEADFDDDNPATKQDFLEKQRARLDKAGDWLTYLKPYKLFLPMIFPFGNRKLQLGIVYLILHLGLTQLIGFLIPHQMGVITDKLVSTSSTTGFPSKEVIFWAVLQLFGSDLSYVIRQVVFLPIHNFVYKSICNTAFRHVMNLSMDFHHDKSSSDVIRTVYQGENLTQIVDFICFELSPLVANTIIALTYVTTMFEPYLMLIMLTAGLVSCWLAEDSNRWARQQRKEYHKAQRELFRSQYEALSNWQTVSQFNHNKYESDKYSKLLEDYCVQDSRVIMSQHLVSTVRGCFMLCARLVATALMMYRVSQGKVPLGKLVTFSAVWNKTMQPISQLARVSRRVQMLLTDSERLLLLLQTQSTVQDKPDAKAFDFRAGAVQLDHVHFAYDSRKSTLSDLSVNVPAGSTVALVGETGGGKTSLIRLLYRYYDVTDGAIRIDGQDIRDVTLDSLRNVFGFVPQDPALFNTTLLENLRYARLDATDEEIAGACRAACIHDKIMQFPDKYQSKVGERGVKLSGGEMQRIAVARAILRDPKIVLLDEATSMIDAETEHLIQKALRRLTAGRTTFVVAHRLSTIQHADLILVIENGRIIEKGNHDELFRQGGKYVKLWSRQMSKHVDLTPASPQSISGLETPPGSD